MSLNKAEDPHTIISVRTPARLHLGFLDLNGSIGRKFGSIGLAVDSHFTHLKIRSAKTTSFGGDISQASIQKLTDILEQFYQTLGQHIPITERAIAVEIIERIPEHSGLGSGTQLALALGTALARLHQINVSTAELAKHLQRGKRSGIGITTFDHGGFVVDGGTTPSNTVPPKLVQCPIPANWRIVMVLSPSFQGIHGQSEITAFQTLPVFPLNSAQAICHLTLMQLLPALVENDLDAFGKAITEIQALVGDHFAPMQGGRYTSQGVAACLEYAKSLGHQGIAQSSWGPTGCIFVKGDEAADTLILQLEKFLQSQKSTHETLSIIKAKAQNSGAMIETMT